MTTQFDDLYDFYQESSDIEDHDDDQQFHNLQKKNQFHSYKQALFVVLVVIGSLVVIECLKRFIKSRRKKSELSKSAERFHRQNNTNFF